MDHRNFVISCVKKERSKHHPFDLDLMTRRDREVVDFTRYHVKNKTEFTNLMKMYRTEGYNGK